MSHDYESAAWAEHHGRVSAGIAHMIDKAREAFELLVAIEYAAPWEACRH